MPCLYSEGERETPGLEPTCRVFLAELGAREIHRTELHADARGEHEEDPSPIRLSTQPRIVQTHNHRISYQVYGSLAAR